MTSAIVNLTEENNRVLNIIKAHLGFRNKSDAINYIVTEYAKDEELQLRPEYVKKIAKMMKRPMKPYSSLAEMAKEYE
jgi:hypothetical protein